MNNVMFDIETLGVRPGSIVLSIGAVEFDDVNTGNELSVHIDHCDAAKLGLTVDASTVMWWLSQSQEAQCALLCGTPVSVSEAVEHIALVFPNIKNQRVWANGAAFDFPILSAMNQAVGKENPWCYSNEMDMRTVKGLVGPTFWKQHRVPPTIAHDGLADAISQAKSLQNVLAAKGLSEWLR